MFRDGAGRLLVFRVGAERFAIALAAIDEVIEAPTIQPLPDSPTNMLGVAIVRGEVLPIYDPRPMLHVGGRVDGAVLLFERGGRPIGLAVEDVDDALTIEAHELRPAPGTEAADGLLIGIVRRASDLIAVLDAEALLDVATKGSEGERR